MKKIWLVGLLAVGMVLTACGKEVSTATTAQATGASETPAVASNTVNPTQSADPTVEATPEPSQQTTFAVGDAVTITNNGEDWATFTVEQVKQAKQYVDPQGFYNDKPQQKGDIFLAAKVKYTALVNGVDYNPFDFQVFADDQALNNPQAFVTSGPTPELGSGTLPKGRSAEGWLVYEVPIKGSISLSYGGQFGGDGPVFEVTLR